MSSELGQCKTWIKQLCEKSGETTFTMDIAYVNAHAHINANAECLELR